MTVKELRQLGYRVKIKHQRHFRLRNLYLKKDIYATTGQIRFDDDKVISDIVREAYNKVTELQRMMIVYLDGTMSKKEDRIKAITKIFDLDNNDGLTTVDIIENDVIIGTGYSKVNGKPDEQTHKRDVFSRHTGVYQALDKALEDAFEKGYLNQDNLAARLIELRAKGSKEQSEVKS